MNALYKIINIQKLPIILAGVLAVTTISCQKKLDYSRPADANTFEGDKTTTFKYLTDNEDAVWAWDMPYNLLDNKFPSLLLQFFKDSTANIYSIPSRGIIAELQGLRASGTLTPAESSAALSLITAFGNLADYQIRDALEDPRNITFKNRTLALLPNYDGFRSLDIFLEEESGSFDMNGPVQLSLTFHNSELLAMLKEGNALDFDFRVMKASKDSAVLDGYYANSANKKSMLYKSPATPVNFVMCSRITLAVNPVKANVSMRTGGTVIPTPAGYNSGLNFFYRTFDQKFDINAGFGYVPNGNGGAATPDVLKTAKILIVKSFLNGSPLTAPAGTVLFTLTVVNTDGSTKDVDFIKN